MPTGYTAQIKADTTLNEWAWECARAFGALVMLRDDSDAKIPKAFEPNDYHSKSLLAAKESLRDAERMSLSEAGRAAGDDFDKETRQYRASQLEKRVRLGELNRMKSMVESWEPPTPEHHGMKKFMLEQIETDASSERYESSAPVLLDPQAWIDESIASAKHDIEYHAKAYDEEVARIAGRNAWLEALRKSIGDPVSK